MLRTYTEIERGFVKNNGGNIVGLEPLSIKEQMVYRKNGVDSHFGYDTRKHNEENVQNMLERYPAFVSKLFGNAISYFSRLLWRR
jgi:hypothetical protein